MVRELPDARFELREITRDDVDSVVDIISKHQPVDGAQARAYYDGYFGGRERSASDRERSYVVVDIPSANVIGVGGYAPDKYDWSIVLWLSWLYVAERIRRHGVGSRLLVKIVDDARRLGANKLYLDTSSDPSYAAAVAMYERFGFREEGRLKNYYGAHEDMIIMGMGLE